MEEELLHICSYLTPRVAETVRYYRARGARIEEIRLRREGMLSFTAEGTGIPTQIILSAAEFEENFLRLAEQSVYTHANTLRAGFLQVAGGYRVGVCGTVILEGSTIRNLSEVTSLNIRIPYRPRGGSTGICRQLLSIFPAGGLIFSPPSGGKTTLLSDIGVTLSGDPNWRRVAVIDSRGEICIGNVGAHTMDVLRGYPKALGVEIATRTLSPEYILCDEIGTEKEADAMLGAMHAGVAILATAHASSITELFAKEWVRYMHKSHIFGVYIQIKRTASIFEYSVLRASEVIV